MENFQPSHVNKNEFYKGFHREASRTRRAGLLPCKHNFKSVREIINHHVTIVINLGCDRGIKLPCLLKQEITNYLPVRFKSRMNVQELFYDIS